MELAGSALARHAVAPAVVIGAAASAWLLAGVGLAEIALFGMYQLGWVLGPGLALHRLLDPAARGLERLVVGWALGYAISIAAFHATAAVGRRELFFGVPLLALAALPLIRRRSKPEERNGVALPAGSRVGLALVAALGVVFMTLSLAPLTPLPGKTSAAYPPDPMFHLSVAAEARHHFPVTDPKIAGTPLPYHLFAHYDMAGINQATGIALPVSVFRLSYVPLVVLIVLAAGLLAALAGARRWGIPLAAAIFLFVGEIDLQPWSYYPFWGGTFFGLTFSPSFLLSVPLFGALLTVLRRLGSFSGRQLGLWAIFAALAWALGGAKAGSLAFVVAGCLLYAVLRRLRDGAVDRRALVASAVTAAIAAVQLFVIYGGAGSDAVALRFLGATRSSSTVDALVHWLAIVGPLGTLLAWAIGLLALVAAPVLAVVWAPRREPAWPLYAAFAAAGSAPLLLLAHPGGSQLHLAQLGLLAATALAGVGAERLFAGLRPGARSLLLASALAWVGLVVALAYLPSSEGSDAQALRYFGLLVLGAAAIGGAAVVRVTRPHVPRLLVLLALAAAAVNVPLDTIGPLAATHREGTSLSEGDDVTPPFYDALSWIRRNTPEDAVLAVNNQHTTHRRYDNFVSSALAERRVFLEGWLYSRLTVNASYLAVASGRATPYADRQRLNDAAFEGDAHALDVLATQYGVRYLVVDKLHAEPRARAGLLGRLVFSNEAVDVIAVS
jgi:hypothetical protein